MTVTIGTAPPFDQNDKKYFTCFGKLHITRAARIVSVVCVVCLSIELLFTLTSSLLLVVLSRLLRRHFRFSSVWLLQREATVSHTVPHLPGDINPRPFDRNPTQALSLILTGLSLFIFIIAIGVNSGTVAEMAEDFWGVNPNSSQEQFNRDMASFTVFFILFVCVSGFIQAYFLEIIYSLHQFLKERETSFNFNMDTTASYANADVFATMEEVPPAYNNLK